MKKNFRFQLCCVCMAALMVAGCEVKKPEGVLSEGKMENVLYDFHIAKAMGENLQYNESYKKALYAEAVFKKHGTTEANFDSSMVWYTRNTELLSKIYEKVNKRLKAQQEQINHLIALRDKKPLISAPGDSIQVWAWQHMARLTNAPLTNRFVFVLPADTNFKKKDALEWEVRYRYLGGTPDSTVAAIMAMQIVYENDSIISETQKIFDSGIHQIRLQGDTLGGIREVNGFIYYPQGKAIKTLIADRFSLMRYHSNDTLSQATKDSLRTDSLRTDSLRKDSLKKKVETDTVKTLPVRQQRLSPEEMNRPSNEVRPVRPEQRATEEHIEREKEQLQRQQRNQRRPIRR